MQSVGLGIVGGANEASESHGCCRGPTKFAPIELYSDTEKLEILEKMERRGMISHQSAMKVYRKYINPPKIPVKLSFGAKMPTKAHDTDAGWDLYANGYCQIPPLTRRTISTGVFIAIPEGYVGLVWPRSGLAVKNGADIFAGVIDSGYRGEILVCIYNSDPTEYMNFYQGNKVAQILFQEVPKFELVLVDELDSTERNTGGFGSSGA